MASHLNEKGQALTLSCIVMFFIFTSLIIGMTDIYKTSGETLKEIERKSFWENKR